MGEKRIVQVEVESRIASQGTAYLGRNDRPLGWWGQMNSHTAVDALVRVLPNDDVPVSELQVRLARRLPRGSEEEGMKLQRYDLVDFQSCGETHEEMRKAEDGEWVRFDDVNSAPASRGEVSDSELDAIIDPDLTMSSGDARKARLWMRRGYRLGTASHPAPATDAKLQDALGDMIDTVVQWMTGSADFGEGGTAHDGWVKARPKLFAAMDLLRLSRIQGLDGASHPARPVESNGWAWQFEDPKRFAYVAYIQTTEPHFQLYDNAKCAPGLRGSWVRVRVTEIK